MTQRMNPLLKLVIEIGPLVAFFFVNARMGIFWATGVFMVSVPISLALAWKFEGRIPMLPLVTGLFVLVFGGLTLVLQDELFIKLKPTIVNILFGSILLIGLAMGRAFLKNLMGSMFAMHDRGWRILTFRWAMFFFFLAILNEVVWRNFSTDDWVNFKVFGIMPLTLLFSLSQLPTMNRYRLEEEEA